MKNKRFLIFGSTLLVIALVIRLYSSNAERVEDSYSNGIYPYISTFLRHIFGWLPFSFGDILYGAIFLFILWKIIKGISALFKRKVSWRSFGRGCIKLVTVLVITYVLFNALWGINYNRKGIASQLELKMEKYSLDELKNINDLLVQKVNASKQTLLDHPQNYPSSKELFARVQAAYAIAESTYPFLQYRTLSIKPSMWGWLGSYLGFTGYYNPFTGEAQVNTRVPQFLQPFVASHEVAHQLGYAKEMEANFVGYLAGIASKDTLLHYSIYLDMFLYSNRNLSGNDSTAAKTAAKQLLPAVKNDIAEWRNFNRRHRNPFEPVFQWLYGKYLQINQQPQGVLSYDEVTGFIIAYYKKYGKI